MLKADNDKLRNFQTKLTGKLKSFIRLTCQVFCIFLTRSFCPGTFSFKQQTPVRILYLSGQGGRGAELSV